MAKGQNLEAYKKIIFWGLLFIIAVLPFLFTTKTSDLVLIKTVFFQLGLSFLFFIWFLKSVDSEFIKIPRNPVLFPFFLFILYAFLSALFSRYKYTSFHAFYANLSYFLLFILVTESIENRAQIRLISQTILIVAGIICFFSISQNITFLKFRFWTRPIFYHFLGNPNFFAAYLIAVVPLNLSLFIYSRRENEKAILFILLILISSTLFLTYSQGSWLILFFYFILFYIGIFVKYCRQRDFQKVFISILFLFLLSINIWFLKVNCYDWLRKYFLGSSNSIIIRQAIWMGSWRMIKDFPYVNPILGWGVGTFHLYFPLFKTAEFSWMLPSSIVLHAHNEFLELTTEMGLLGLALFLWIIFAILLLGLKLWLEAPLTWKKYSLAFSLGCLGVLMHNMISPSLRMTIIGVFFWLMAALIVSVNKMVKRESGSAVLSSQQNSKAGPIILENKFYPIFKPIRKGLLYGFTVILFFSLSLQIIKPYQAELVLKRGLKNLNEGNLPQAIMRFEEAKKIDPNCCSAYYKLAYSYRMIGQNQEALKNYLALERIAPGYARIHCNLGQVYYDLGMFQEAINEFKIALKREDAIVPRCRLKQTYRKLREKKLEKEQKQEIKRVQKIFFGE